jgi:hypothetical protein
VVQQTSDCNDNTDNLSQTFTTQRHEHTAYTCNLLLHVMPVHQLLLMKIIVSVLGWTYSAVAATITAACLLYFGFSRGAPRMPRRYTGIDTGMHQGHPLGVLRVGGFEISQNVLRGTSDVFPGRGFCAILSAHPLTPLQACSLACRAALLPQPCMWGSGNGEG